MIHTFKAVGQPMLLDVGSGAVHAIDDMAFDVLEMWNDHTPEEIRDALKEKYTAQELDEVISELKQLEELGALNAPDNYDDVKQVTEPGVVKSMCLHAAHDCNLRCKYCFAATGDFCMGERKLLPYEVGKAAIDWLVAHSGKRVNLELDFFGGEPLMNFPVVKRLVEYGRSIEKEKNKHFKFTMTTNCVLMNDEIMDFLNKEMSNVVISIDGRREVHDRMRPTINGKGSYDIIMNKAQEFVRRRNACDKEYYVRGTFTGFNKDFGNDVLHLADQGFDQISVEPVVTDPKCEYALREEDLPEIPRGIRALGADLYGSPRERQVVQLLPLHGGLGGRPVPAQASDRLRRGQRVCCGNARRRYLPLPPVCRPRRLPHGQCAGRHVRPRHSGEVRAQHGAEQGEVPGLLGTFLLLRRLRCECRSLPRRHFPALRHGVPDGAEAP